MKTAALLILSILFSAFTCSAQTRLLPGQHDSLCQFGKKYTRPKREHIDFPFKIVSEAYKKAELHKAIPKSFDNEDDLKHPVRYWLYHYYFGTDHLYDYNPKLDSIVQLPKARLSYILNDTYFFDINGDGLLDFIHYPKYYMAIERDRDAYEIFIQQKKDDYKIITFRGFITAINFNKDGTLNTMSTYQGPCCDDDQCTFYFYTFDNSANELVLTTTEQIFTCQLIKK